MSLTSISGVLLIIGNLSLLPLIIISSIVLYQNQDTMYFQKRGISFLVVHLLFVLVNNVVAQPINIAFKYLKWNKKDNNSLLLSQIIEYFVYIFTMAILLNIVFRLFYQFIQIERSKHTQLLITVQEPNFFKNEESNHSLCTNDTNDDNSENLGKLTFFLENYNIFGNPTRICIIGLTIWLLISICLGFGFIVNNESIELIIRLSIYLIVLITMTLSVVYLAKKQHIFKFKDHWKIRDEFKKFGYVLLFAGML